MTASLRRRVDQLERAAGPATGQPRIDSILIRTPGHPVAYLMQIGSIPWTTVRADPMTGKPLTLEPTHG